MSNIANKVKNFRGKKQQDVTKKEIENQSKKFLVVGVLFEVTKKKYYFEVSDKTTYKKNDYVLVDTIRGQEVGIIYTDVMSLTDDSVVLPLKPIIKKINEKELARYNRLKIEAEKALNICKEKSIKHKLEMKLIASEYTFDKTKLIFYFTAEGRVDFRELVKDLANVFRIRIELRQIGVRDEARILGTIGICGKELCCRTCINKFDSVSIKMARDQGIVINPSKISGICGRLLCCINYEYKQYEEALKNYPAVGQMVDTPKGAGKVISLTPLSGYLFVNLENIGLTKFTVDEIKFNKKESVQMRSINSEEDAEIEAELKGD